MKRQIFAVALALSLPFGAAQAEEQAVVDAINEVIKTVIPDGKADKISATPVPGIYEVVIGSDVFYMTKDARYIFQGDLVDWQERRNFADETRAELRKDLLKQLDEKEMIVFAPENPKYKVTVFTDIDCGYCRKLHSEMQSYNDLGIAIRYVAYPRSGLNTPSYFKFVAAWCSKDQKAALTEAKLGKEIKKEIEDCKDPVEKQLNLAYSLGLRGTPTLFLEDGRMLPGYVPAAELINVITNKQ